MATPPHLPGAPAQQKWLERGLRPIAMDMDTQRSIDILEHVEIDIDWDIKIVKNKSRYRTLMDTIYRYRMI